MKNIVKVSLAGALGFAAVSGIAHAQSGASDKAFSGRLALYSEYEFRGISQTSEKPALQLNLDYAQVSGFYVGTFLSNINWLKDTAEQNGFNSNSKIEWNLYGGYKFQPVENLTLDFGYLHFEYPNSSDFSPRPNTDELYIDLWAGQPKIFNLSQGRHLWRAQ